MKLVIGWIVLSALAVVSLLGFLGYIRLPYPILWYVIVVLYAFLLTFWTAFSSLDNSIDKLEKDSFKAFKATSRQLAIDIDQCEFNNGSNTNEVIDENLSNMNLIKPPGTFNYEPTIMENVQSSWFVFIYKDGNNSLRYRSQSFPFDVTTLRYHVLNNNITLHIDRSDPKRYMFNLVEL